MLLRIRKQTEESLLIRELIVIALGDGFVLGAFEALQ